MAEKGISAAKRIRQSEKRRLRNQSWKTRIKTFEKKVAAVIASKDTETADSTLRETIGVISKASSKGVIHKSTASRKISRLSRRVSRAFKSEVVS